VPEPHRSHDCALVPAKPGFQGWILMNVYIYIYIHISVPRTTKGNGPQFVSPFFVWQSDVQRNPVTAKRNLNTYLDPHLSFSWLADIKKADTCVRSSTLWYFFVVYYEHEQKLSVIYTGCPTCYRTWDLFNTSNTNEDIATKFEQQYVRCMRNEEECVCSALQISLQYPH